jgi:hypothetical protein
MTGAQLPGVFGHLQPVLEHAGYLAVGGFVLLEERHRTPFPEIATLVVASNFTNKNIPQHVGAVEIRDQLTSESATRPTGATQPESPAALWNPRGYANNAWAHVKVSAR